MKRHLQLASILAAIVLVAAAASPASAARRAVPRSGGRDAPRAARTATPRGSFAPRATAHGIAHYGYYGGHGHVGYYGGWWGYPYYDGWWGPGWNLGLNAWWGWPYTYGPYGYAYVPYAGPAYVIGREATGPAVVETAVTPKNAEVVLDGTSVGYAKDYNGRWDELSVSPGHHTIELRDTGYKTLVIDLNAAPGTTYRIDRELSRGSGEDRLTVGKPKAATAEAPAARATVEPASASGVVRGLLRVHATPSDAGVYLDGEFLGLAGELDRLHGAIPVATGSHRLQVVRPGYAEQTKTVDVGTGNTASVDIALAKE